MSLTQEILSGRDDRNSNDPDLIEAAKQHIRIRFFIFGSLVVFIAWCMVLYAEFSGLGRPGAAIWLLVSAIVVEGGVAFLLFTGFNRRFTEKSLTIVQLVIYVFLETLVILLAPDLRYSVAVWYCISLTFGVFRLRAYQAWTISCLVIALYLMAITFLWQRGDIAHHFEREAIAFASLVLFVICYCVVVEYVTRLRRRANAIDLLQRVHLKLGSEDFEGDFQSKILNFDFFCRTLKNYELLAQMGKAEFTLAEIILRSYQELTRDLSRDAVESMYKYFTNRLVQCAPKGSVVCYAGEGRFLVLCAFSNLSTVTKTFQKFISTESDHVLLLPEVPKALNVKFSVRFEASQ